MLAQSHVPSGMKRRGTKPGASVGFSWYVYYISQRISCFDRHRGDDESTFPCRWAALESIEYMRCNSKSDVWSFGVTMWEIFTRCEKPYGRKTNHQIIESLKRGARLPGYTEDREEINAKAYVVMKKCWLKEPDQRPTFKELKEDLENLFLYHQKYSSKA